MIVAYSFRDVLRIPEFKGLNQFDLLQTNMDSKVQPYLFSLGADTNRTMSIQGCKHRSSESKQAIVGYRYAFHERMDKEWTSTRQCSLSARIHSQVDKDLAAEMVRMSQESVNWESFEKYAIAVETKKAKGKLVIEDVEAEEDYYSDLEEMAILRDIQMSIRGSLSADEDMFYTGE